MPTLIDLGIDLHHVDIQVMAYPNNGSTPTVLGNSHRPLDLSPAWGVSARCSHPLRNPLQPSWPFRIEIESMTPGRPGWVACKLSLLTASGLALVSRSPAEFYAHPTDGGSWVYRSPLDALDVHSYAINLWVQKP